MTNFADQIIIIMKRSSGLLIIVLLLTAYTAFAQKKASISFTSTEHDFGKIKEADGSKTFKFEFSNTGKDTLILQNVTSVSSCVTMNWSKTPVPPGKKSSIDVIFDPKNRIGPFQKGVDVLTNDSAHAKLVLLIKGEVEGSIQSSANGYPRQMGHLYSKPSQMTFKNIFTTGSKTDTLKLYNEWNKPMTLAFTKAPAHIICKAVPEELKPLGKGYVLITYDAAKKNDYGYVFDLLTIVTNDSLEPEKKIGISANIIEDFSKLTPEQSANAPKVNFDNTTFDFGTIKEGEKPEHDFKLTNTGKSELMIRKAKAACGCTLTTAEKSNLKPGESTNIHVLFNSKNQVGKQQKTVNVFCNDPANPSTILHINGTVEK
jgi:hypothetical protein